MNEKQVRATWMAKAISRRRHQYMATDKRTNKQTKRQTEGRCPTFTLRQGLMLIPILAYNGKVCTCIKPYCFCLLYVFLECILMCVKALYERLQVTFLLDELDTIVAYEERGKQKTASAASSYQQGIDAFTSSLGRVQQIELLQGKLACMSSLQL